MTEVAVEYRCFVGGLAWATDDRSLGDAFKPFGDVIESKVISDRETGRSRGFGFVTFKEEQSMKDAIESLNGTDLDGRNITVHQAQQRPSNNNTSSYKSNGGGGGGGRYNSSPDGTGGGGGGGYSSNYNNRRNSGDGGGGGGGGAGGAYVGGGGGGGGGRRYGGARSDGRSDVGSWRKSDG